MDILNDIFEEVLEEDPVLRERIKSKVKEHLHEMDLNGVIEAVAERVLAEQVENAIIEKYSVSVEIFEESGDEEFLDEDEGFEDSTTEDEEDEEDN